MEGWMGSWRCEQAGRQMGRRRERALESGEESSVGFRLYGRSCFLHCHGLTFNYVAAVDRSRTGDLIRVVMHDRGCDFRVLGELHNQAHRHSAVLPAKEGHEDVMAAIDDRQSL